MNAQLEEQPTQPDIESAQEELAQALRDAAATNPQPLHNLQLRYDLLATQISLNTLETLLVSKGVLAQDEILRIQFAEVRKAIDGLKAASRALIAPRSRSG
jgi:hypothetical protein